MFVPMLPFYQFRALLRNTFIQAMIKPFNFDRVEVSLSEDNVVARDWSAAGYERNAFDILTLLMAMANVPPLNHS